MGRFKDKTLEWLGDQYMTIDDRIADRTRQSKRKLNMDNQADEKLLEEITTQINAIQKDDVKAFIDWAIKNKKHFIRGTEKETTDG